MCQQYRNALDELSESNFSMQIVLKIYISITEMLYGIEDEYYAAEDMVQQLETNLLNSDLDSLEKCQLENRLMEEKKVRDELFYMKNFADTFNLSMDSFLINTTVFLMCINQWFYRLLYFVSRKNTLLERWTMHSQQFDQVRAGFFDNLAVQWDEMSPAPADDRIESFLDRLNISAGNVVLDVGTGTGLLVPYLMKYDPAKIIAMDLSEKMLGRLADKYQTIYHSRLEILHSDVHCLNISDQSVDVAICNSVFPHFHDKPLALAELYRVLKPGGELSIHHFAGREKINSVHTALSHELIRMDILESVADLSLQVCQAGFLVRETADNETEYYLIAAKP
jgi:demethylmenaquinone methyltransferase/2-methoxy-6-polyprenyl-1,4-benzoquinol methylase